MPQLTVLRLPLGFSVVPVMALQAKSSEVFEDEVVILVGVASSVITEIQMKTWHDFNFKIKNLFEV